MREQHVHFFKTSTRFFRKSRILCRFANREFYDAFGVKEGDKLWLPAKDRVRIW